MKTLRWAIASSLVGVWFAGTSMAQSVTSSPVQQPGLIRQMGFQSDDNGYTAAESAGAVGAAAPAASGSAAVTVSPSNMPPAPPSPVAQEQQKKEEAKQPAAEAAKEEEQPAEEGPYKIFHQGSLGEWEDCHHVDIRGFIDGGYTSNPDYPLNRFNGPVGYNDRADELELNQLYFTVERLAKVENDCGIDYGYRMDLLYGTDSRYARTIPGSQWDSGWNNGNRFYGLAMPQLYGTLQYDKLTLEGGHFYAPVGYETVNADGNFFYSHTYSFLYGEPTTLTGGYATYKVKDKLLVNGGFDTGWNEFTAINGKMNGFFGVDWTSPDKNGNFEVTEEVFLGNTQPNADDGSFRYLFNTVAKVKIGPKWLYVMEMNFAHDSSTAVTAGAGGFGPGPAGFGAASWTGWSNYLLYTINECWAFGLRYEYFEDLDGAVVTRVGPPSDQEAGSKWQDFTMGLNWKPNTNVTLRSEVRWDSAENGAPVGSRPFDDGLRNTQFLWGNDVIIRY